MAYCIDVCLKLLLGDITHDQPNMWTHCQRPILQDMSTVQQLVRKADLYSKGLSKAAIQE